MPVQHKKKLESYRFHCDICNRLFHKPESLHNHRLTHDVGEDNQLNDNVCEICGKTCSSKRALASHKKNYHSAENSQKLSKQYPCEFCNKSYNRCDSLRVHLRTHTGERPYLCPECGKAFSQAGNLKQHRLRHGGEKSFECPYCPAKFTCPNDVCKHKAVHKGIKKHICDICGASFSKSDDLKRHKMLHSGEKPYKCDYCEMRFNRMEYQRCHMRTHTGEKPYKCKYCERAFAQSNDHVKHLRRHLGANVYRCELCPLSFRLASEMRLHFVLHKNEDGKTRERNMKALKDEEAKLAQLYSDGLQPTVTTKTTTYNNKMSPANEQILDSLCRTCMQEIDNVWKYIFDTVEECGDKRIAELLSNTIPQIEVQQSDLPKKICSKCLQQLLSVYRFQEMCTQSDQQIRAMIAKRITDSKISITKEFTQDENTSKALKQASFLESNERQIECGSMNALLESPADPLRNIEVVIDDFKDKTDNLTHEKLQHPTEVQRNHRCDFCDKSFKKAKVLRAHIRRHTGERPFLCPQCGKSFCDSSGLRRHIYCHDNDKPFECPYCPSKFRSPHEVISHKIIHQEVKPYICDICSYGFRTSNQLLMHKRWHNNEKPYKCDCCEMRFIRMTAQRRHMRTHTGEKPYKCKYCGRAYSQNNDHMKHLRIHLGDNVYRCKLCPLAFPSGKEMRSHFLMHKNEIPQAREQNMKALLEEEAKLQLKFAETNYPSIKMATSEQFFDFLCRTCMHELTEFLYNDFNKKPAQWQSIFDTIEDCGDLQIAQLLSKTIPQIVKVEPSDELPKKICSGCLEQLLNLFRFQQMCTQSDKQMRALVDKRSKDSKISIKKSSVKNKTKSSECLKLESLLDANQQTIEFESVNTTPEPPQVHPVDPLQNIEVVMEHRSDSEEDASKYFKNEPCEDAGESDGETLPLNVFVKNKMLKVKTAEKQVRLSGEQPKSIQHEKTDTNLLRNICDSCKGTFSTLSSLKRHKRRFHSGTKPKKALKKIACELCDETYNTHSKLEEHRQLRHSSELRKEQEILDGEKTQSLYNEQMDRVLIAYSEEGQGRLAYEQTPSLHNAQIDIARSAGKQTESLDSEKIDKILLGNICGICENTFSTKSSLKRHIKRYHSIERPKRVLKLRSGNLNTDKSNSLPKPSRHKKKLLDSTQKQQKRLKQFACQLCDKTYKNSEALKIHIRKHTGERPYLCPECGKSFSDPSNLKQHILRHGDEKLFECPYCPLKFRCPNYVAQHKMIHEGIKRHICDICGAGFTKSCQLAVHKRYHNNEKPFKCEYCEMCFVRKSAQRVHMRTHTGEKPYECKYCDRAFAQSGDHIKHLRTHLGDNVYRCELCPLTFRLASELRVHFATHKKVAPDTPAELIMKVIKEEDAKLLFKFDAKFAQDQGTQSKI
ncbi:zinc finger protein 91-like [Eurosta solidaginis]|uniref:zinc finger protein 91-like n=1 Tax=Eurosta solidaginis TaxID=178769 RepID=UPI00353073A3